MCNEREQLIGYLYNECSAEERRRVEEHLEQCDACRHEVAGLRRVREDLLAWDVPDHGSVWQPFAPVQAAPWWRGVPAWAMAAAAGVMFVIGAAGAVVTHALVPHVQDTQATVIPVATGLSTQDLDLAESRILNTVRAELGSQVELAAASFQPASSPTPAVDFSMAEERALRQMRSILEADKDERLAWFSTVNTELNRADGRMDLLERDMETVKFILDTIQGR
jgi:hypothetical protein